MMSFRLFQGDKFDDTQFKNQVLNQVEIPFTLDKSPVPVVPQGEF